VLDIDTINVSYGAIQALYNLSLRVAEGTIVAMLGGNGAGKTTILNTISGLRKPNSGSILFEGEKIDGMRPHKIVRMGIIQVPEGRKIFSDLSVSENLRLASCTRKDKKEIRKDYEEVLGLFPILHERTNYMGKELSGGEQQMLAIARGMMSKPRLLMLDEPSLGLAPIINEAIFRLIKSLHDHGMTILLSEQNATFALKIADEAYILENGKIFKHDTVEHLRSDPVVREVYLGI
jgi:branched-chain amino acid transport system ATP-binding protein